MMPHVHTMVYRYHIEPVHASGFRVSQVASVGLSMSTSVSVAMALSGATIAYLLGVGLATLAGAFIFSLVVVRLYF